MEDEENDELLNPTDLVYLQQNKIKNGDTPSYNGDSLSGFESMKTLDWSNSGWEKDEVR